jgi:enoyl-CoA hydratase
MTAMSAPQPPYDRLETSTPRPGVRLVRLNRPATLNAWDEAMVRDLIRLWRDLDRDPEVRAIVVTGAGAAFSVGGDFDHLEKLATDADATCDACVKDFADLVRGIVDLDKPVIAAINGDAVGGGATLALCSDISMMSDRARILTGAQLNLGLVPAEAPYLWPFLCSMAKAKYYLLSPQFIDAAEAERIGLVSVVVPHDELLTRALDLAEGIARRDTLAVGWTKRALNQHLRQAAPILDFALAAEGLGFLRPGTREKLERLRKGKPRT